MRLTPQTQHEFRSYVAHRLLLELERLIPEYIHTHHHLQDDIEDKGFEEVNEAFIAEASNLTFIWD